MITRETMKVCRPGIAAGDVRDPACRESVRPDDRVPRRARLTVPGPGQSLRDIRGDNVDACVVEASLEP